MKPLGNIVKYLDVDSSYRNRELNPLPAQFTVHLSPSGQANTGLQSISPVSEQVVAFPPQNPLGTSQLQLEPIAFYNDDSTVTERLYLPYMFLTSTDTDTIVRLDELPIAPTSPTDLNAPLAIDFPRSVVPLGQANNFYINRYLENMNTGEFRKIVSFTYDTSQAVLQTVNIVAFTVTDLSVTVQLDAAPANAPSPSNIDRFYQGKYIIFESGESRLIIDSYVDATLSTLLVLQSNVQRQPSMNSSASIVTSFNYYAQLETAFTTAPALYPAYRSPVPANTLAYTKLSILATDPILAMASVRHADNTIGVVYQTGSVVYYISSTDTEGATWNAPVTIFAISAGGGLYSTNFLDARNVGIALCIINGNPAIAFPCAVAAEVSTSHTVFYVRATSIDGSTWPVVTFATPTVVTNLWYSSTSRLALLPQPDSTAYGFANAGYPVLLYASSDQSIIYRRGSVSYDSPTWSSLDTGEDGYVMSMALVSGWDDIPGTVPGDPNTVYPNFLFKRLTDGFLYMQYWDGAAAARVQLTTATVSMYGTLSSFDLVTDYTFQAPTIVYQDNASNDIYYIGFSLFTNFDPGSICYFQPQPASRLTEDTLLIPSVVLASPLAATVSNDVVYVANDSVTTINVDYQSFSATPSRVFDTAVGITVITALPNVAKDKTVIIYESQNSEIDILIPTSTDNMVSTQYRIRNGIPQVQSSTILAGTQTTIQLSAADTSSRTGMYVGSYIWVYNKLTNPVPSPWLLYNDYRQITAYNGTTHTATVSSDFSYSIADGLSDLQYEILAFDHDGFCPLVVVSTEVQQLVCYELQLLNLVLPNVVLSVWQGNLPAFLPYVYVRFTNVSARNRNVIYSNNPHATDILFKIVVNNTVQPTSSTFVPLFGSGMTQTIAFLPLDNFEFAVVLPNGEIFQTLQGDRMPPFPPNPNLQVSATFALRRMV